MQTEREGRRKGGMEGGRERRGEERRERERERSEEKGLWPQPLRISLPQLKPHELMIKQIGSGNLNYCNSK